jgi:hypothetical protein
MKERERDRERERERKRERKRERERQRKREREKGRKEKGRRKEESRRSERVKESSAFISPLSSLSSVCVCVDVMVYLLWHWGRKKRVPRPIFAAAIPNSSQILKITFIKGFSFSFSGKGTENLSRSGSSRWRRRRGRGGRRRGRRVVGRWKTVECNVWRRRQSWGRGEGRGRRRERAWRCGCHCPPLGPLPPNLTWWSGLAAAAEYPFFLSLSHSHSLFLSLSLVPSKTWSFLIIDILRFMMNKEEESWGWEKLTESWKIKALFHAWFELGEGFNDESSASTSNIGTVKKSWLSSSE